MEILQVARTKVLHPDEFVAHRDSLVQIIYVFMARIERLKGEHVVDIQSALLMSHSIRDIPTSLPKFIGAV